MKKNILVKSILFVLSCIEFVLLSVILGVGLLIIQPFVWSFTKGKKNVRKDDEARVFIANHYEIYGPFIVFLRFPFKFRPWTIDKMCDPKTIENHMRIGLYNNYKWIPKWVKFILLKTAKRLVLFAIKFAKPIPVSRDNLRANIKTMQLSIDVLNKNQAIFIFPERNAVKEGVGEFMSGFEHLGKYYYQKTGKRISFYPVFISKKNRSMYIEEPIIFNPENDPNLEKERIVNGLHNAIHESYIKHEKSNKKSK